jgi:hypothetical protein
VLELQLFFFIIFFSFNYYNQKEIVVSTHKYLQAVAFVNIKKNPQKHFAHEDLVILISETFILLLLKQSHFLIESLLV